LTIHTWYTKHSTAYDRLT